MITERQAKTLERTIAEIVGAQVSAEPTQRAVVLTGTVESEEQRGAVEDVAISLHPEVPIENLVSVQEASLEQGGEAANPIEVESPDLASQLRWEDEEQETVFPPTDPVVTLDQRGEVQVLGGFTPTSLDSVEVDESSLGPGAGDLALAEAIERELREDASTTDLNVRVRVYRGVAHISGRVSSMDDAENAETVAASVPGVREVVDEVEVET